MHKPRRSLARLVLCRRHDGGEPFSARLSLDGSPDGAQYCLLYCL
jgi:hypothetical protein